MPTTTGLVMSNNIQELRRAKGLTQRDLADRLSTPDSEVHFTTIAKIERSQRRLTHEWAVRIAEVLGVDFAALYKDGRQAGPSGVRNIPVIGQVAAGQWREAVQHPDDHIVAPVDAKNAFALLVDGDSMDVVAPAGTHVLVDPDALDLLDGRYYVVMNDAGEATFKQYRAHPARLEPLSHNPTHQPIALGREPFSVIGQVVGMYRSFR